MAPQPGDLVTPSVRLRHPLVSGGMGMLWVADHLALNTRVAVKFLSQELALLPDQRLRFSREAAAASQVKSPHVVQMLDHGVTQDGSPFLVMELLEGEDVAQRLKREGPMTLKTVAEILRQVSKALSRAHEAGIVHRDIKPENIFICATGDDEMFCKLLDFGIAKGEQDPSAATQTGTVIGTIQYMSPEQLVASPTIDARSDLWSLGVVVYLLLTGRRPWAGNTVGAITLAVHNTMPPRLTELSPSLPKALDEWFAKACAKDRFDRFRDAREQSSAFAVAAGLASASAQEPSSDTDAQTRPELLASSALEVTRQENAAPMMAPTIPDTFSYQGERAATHPVVTRETTASRESPNGEARRPSNGWWLVGATFLAVLAIAIAVSINPRGIAPAASSSTANGASPPAPAPSPMSAPSVSVSPFQPVSSADSAAPSGSNAPARSTPATPRLGTGKNPQKPVSPDSPPPRTAPPSENEPALQ